MYCRKVVHELTYFNVLIADVCNIVSYQHTYSASTVHCHVNITIKIIQPLDKR